MQPNQQQPNSEQLDPTVVNMARAIKSVETRGQADPYKARGKSGEYGAYQYTEPTWKADSAKYLGQEVPLENATTEQQNKVAYHKIKELKDKGYNPLQVASIWNSGKPDPEGNVGTNKQGVHFDTPQYTKSVVDSYNKFRSGLTPNPQPTTSTVGSNITGSTPESAPEQGLGEQLGGRLSNAATALNKGVTGEINPLSSILQTVGQGAGAVGDVVNKGLELIPGIKQVEDFIGKGVGSAANTGVGKSILNTWQDFAQKHPEAADDIGAVGNILTTIPIFKGFGLAKEAIGTGFEKALGKDALGSLVSDVAPKETGQALAKGIAKRGTTKSLIRGIISPATDESSQQLAKLVADNVPGITKAKDLATKINLTQDATDLMAEDLKKRVIESGSDKLYSFKELSSKISNAEEPISLRGTPFEKQIAPIKKAAIAIAKKNGGKISSLFDATKEFDALVKKTYPNIWDKESSPIRAAVKSVRDTINTYIDDNLPDVGFKESRATQHKLIKAIENMSSKVASGSEKEIGTTRFQRFGKRHPVVSGLIKKTAGAALTGTAAGLGIEGIHHLTSE